jgi:uncharacterized protein (TIGR03790 family)
MPVFKGMVRLFSGRVVAFAAFAIAAAGSAAPTRAEGPGRNLAARVIILANSDDPDSVAIAQHYAEVRRVPVANILSFDMPLREVITWPEFVVTIWRPLEDELVRRGWIDAIPIGDTDAVGRKIYSVSGNMIAALVVCRGVPLKIENDPALFAPVRPLTDHQELRTNAGAVDSELSLLAADTGYPINAYVPNPLFGKDHPSDIDRAKVVEVGRLDGPTREDALLLVDRAVAAERTGLAGRAYVDMGGKFPNGDRWLSATADEIGALGFDLSVDRVPETIPATARFDAPALYFGWYAPDLDGPFALPGFRFPPGAIALHIYSFSAGTLRSATEGWCGPFVARGVTATFGNVYEPFLEYTHRPDILLRGLARGDTLGDAAYRALPVLSWQGILIGDPLYRPFAVPLAEQLKNPGQLPEGLGGYAALRYADLLDSQRKPEEAVSTLREALDREPNLAIGVALARRLQSPGSSGEAIRILASALERDPLPTDHWALAREAADMLSAGGRPDLALAAYRRLFAINDLPAGMRAQWLVSARAAAVAAHNPEQAAAWKRDLNRTVDEILSQKS